LLIYLASFFFVVSFVFFILKILKYDVEYQVIFGMLKLRRGLELFDKLAKSKFSKYWEIFSFYSGFVLLGIALFLIFYGIFTFKPVLTPLIPGAEIHGIYFPIIPTIIAIFVAALVHEASHGVIFRRNKVSLKSWGFFFLGPFLGAFVEPDEEEAKRIEYKKQIAAYNAGSAANVVVAALAFVILLALTPAYSMTIQFTNVSIVGIINNSSAYYAGVPKNATLLKIDNQTVRSLLDVRKVLENKRPRENVTLVTSKGVYELKLGERNGKPFIGILMKQNFKVLHPTLHAIFDWLISIFNWIFAINLGIGIANMLPIYPLDGGKTVHALLEVRRSDARKYTKIISIIVLALVVFNVLLNFA
jgi:membrane-associated protease RseP (regulator of RpoE activity)